MACSVQIDVTGENYGGGGERQKRNLLAVGTSGQLAN
jgi:hypothetical protein